MIIYQGKIYAFFCLILIFGACRMIPKEDRLETGDLIFVESSEKNLSGAISRVTKNGKAEISYDHIGIIEKLEGSIYVLHATTNGGSKKESLKDFLKSQGKSRKAIFRLREEYKKAIPEAIQKANKMLGKPYNFLYILNDSSYYCSDFIERTFRKDSIFELKPMTFINPKTGQTDDFWQSFYDKNDTEVPEGKLGCNPNGLSESSKIYKVFMLQ